MEPDVALGDNIGQDPPWSQVASPVTHTRLFLTTFDSPVLPPFIVPTSFGFSLSHFSITYMFL